MRSEMIFQMFFTRKRLLAHCTAEWLIRRMTFHVSFQASIIRKYIIANVAGEHLDSIVTLAVLCQINRCGERLTADLTVQTNKHIRLVQSTALET